jgi:hypothetical protein
MMHTSRGGMKVRLSVDVSFIVPATSQLQQIVAGTVREAINEFLVDRQARKCSKRTIEFYTTELGYLTHFLDAQGVISMTGGTTGPFVSERT